MVDMAVLENIRIYSNILEISELQVIDGFEVV